MIEQAANHLAALLLRFVRDLLAPSEQGSSIEQSTIVRARIDTVGWIARAPIRFSFVTTATTAAAVALGAWLADSAPVLGQCLVAAGAGCVGLAVPILGVFAAQLSLALPRQRDEARAEVRRLSQPDDLTGLARDFSAWAIAMRASVPSYGVRVIPSLFDGNSEARLEHEKRQDELARLQARARAEYHELFRRKLLGHLGSVAEDPATIDDMMAISERLDRMARDQERNILIVNAVGQPVGASQRSLLEVLFDRVQLAVANERAIEYGDVTADAPDNQAAFAAHFKTLAPAIAGWQQAVDDRDQAVDRLTEWIPEEIQRATLNDPPYMNGTVAECFVEISVGRALRRERNDPREIHLRCVQDVPGSTTRWSAYLHSGRQEVKITELTGPAAASSEGGMEAFTRQIAEMDGALQACFDAVQTSDQSARVTAKQDDVHALQPALTAQMRRWKVTAHLEFAAACPYCLDELGVGEHQAESLAVSSAPGATEPR